MAGVGAIYVIVTENCAVVGSDFIVWSAAVAGCCNCPGPKDFIEGVSDSKVAD